MNEADVARVDKNEALDVRHGTQCDDVVRVERSRSDELEKSLKQDGKSNSVLYK